MKFISIEHKVVPGVTLIVFDRTIFCLVFVCKHTEPQTKAYYTRLFDRSRLLYTQIGTWLSNICISLHSRHMKSKSVHIWQISSKISIRDFNGNWWNYRLICNIRLPKHWVRHPVSPILTSYTLSPQNVQSYRVL